MKATRIKMKTGCSYSYKAVEIDQIYLTGAEKEGYYKKEILYDYLKENPGSIYVNIFPYPDLVPVLSANGEKYVRSEPNDTTSDNLLSLPRE